MVHLEIKRLSRCGQWQTAGKSENRVWNITRLKGRGRCHLAERLVVLIPGVVFHQLLSPHPIVRRHDCWANWQLRILDRCEWQMVCRKSTSKYQCEGRWTEKTQRRAGLINKSERFYFITFPQRCLKHKARNLNNPSGFYCCVTSSWLILIQIHKSRFNWIWTFNQLKNSSVQLTWCHCFQNNDSSRIWWRF